jgi:hypothetical protein
MRLSWIQRRPMLPFHCEELWAHSNRYHQLHSIKIPHIRQHVFHGVAVLQLLKLFTRGKSNFGVGSHQCPHPAQITGIPLINIMRHRPRTARIVLDDRIWGQIWSQASKCVAVSWWETQPILSTYSCHRLCVSKECIAAPCAAHLNNILMINKRHPPALHTVLRSTGCSHKYR